MQQELALDVNHLFKNFGGLQVLSDVNFKIRGPELIGLIGPNGAGKTTLTNILDGALKPSGGTVYLNGKRIDTLPPYLVARAGLGRTFQVTRAFRRMTVMENLLVPAMALHATASRREFEERAREVLDFLTMSHLTNEYGRALSGGQQKLLELGRLLMLDPRIVILDEPFAGVHPRLMEIIYEWIYRVNDEGKAIILISHDMETIFTLSKRLLVLNYGDLIADGDPDVVKDDPLVKAAYLGEDEPAPASPAGPESAKFALPTRQPGQDDSADDEEGRVNA
ncbi:MAG: ABC transporter ATP-binding protein [Caldilineaceae bacterium]|nr:ABC transporter ATP-binding protein [Caldilineaceae bacterium]